MLDTNIVAEMMRNPAGKVVDRIAQVGADGLCISVVTAAELRFGATKSGSAQLLARVEAILARVTIIPLDVPVDAEYGRVRAALEAVGQPIGPNDTLIASHAKSLGAVMVTANTREFERVAGLVVENWMV